MSKFNFKASDIQMSEAEETRMLEEALSIYSKNSTAQGRSLKQIVDSTSQGHLAEISLIQSHGFINDPRKYMDVRSPSGIAVEVKTSKYKNIDIVLEKMAERKSWARVANWIFYYLVEEDQYTLKETYKWDGKSFLPAEWEE